MAAACRKGTTWRSEPLKGRSMTLLGDPRGADLVLGGRIIARIRWYGAGSWYFYADGYNSLIDGAGTFASIEEAKRECRSLVLERGL